MTHRTSPGPALPDAPNPIDAVADVLLRDPAHEAVQAARQPSSSRLFASRFGGLYLLGLLVVIAGVLLRTILLVGTASAGLSAVDVVRAYAVGFFFDLVTYSYIAIPAALYTLLVPDRLFRSAFNRWLTFGFYCIFVVVLLFQMAAEWLFWDEFGCRFNFIAVDYLVYTAEVVGNIRESYPVHAILGGIAAAAALIVLVTRRYMLRCCKSTSTFRGRLVPGAVFLAAPLLSWLLVTSSLAAQSSNHYANEMSKNGLYSMAEAFRANTIQYDLFYVTRDNQEVFARLRELLKVGNNKYLGAEPTDIRRQVTYPGPARRHNVVILTIESLSAEFLGVFGNSEGLTPHLDRLADESLFFTRAYATGTRTVRGLEAIAMSIPPTPGASVIKRPDHGEVFCLPRIFRRNGYDTCFVYGGYGYFDNMNEFFSSNGCRIVDRADLKDDETTFTTAWGVCDEDLFNRVLKEADGAFARKVPFFHLVVSTSNHRPYRYPQKIDIPSGSGRSGAVKYTDFAIGDFLRKARSKPWFQDTIFVIVADHCHNSAGKAEVPVSEYHIPILIYAPKIVQPKRCDALCSQIDLGPTLLGMLNVSYVSRFFGKDVLRHPPGRAFVGTYQNLGFYADDMLTILKPGRKRQAYRVNADKSQVLVKTNDKALLDAITYYQAASYLLRNHLLGAN